MHAPAHLHDCVLICTVIDSFTPTKSGTTGTIAWEYAQAARRAGAEPLVIARRQDADPYPWPRSQFVDWPYLPTSRLGTFLMRAQRKYTGWQHFREGAFCRRLARAIKKAGAQRHIFLLQNDVEPAVYLRKKFPHAFIMHHFQNQQECRPQFRKRFAGACNIVSAVSNYTSRFVEDYYRLPANSCHTIYNGVDPDRFHPAETVPPGPPIINFVGRTGADKAPDLILKAALILAQKTTNFSVQIVGSNHALEVVMDDYQRELQSLSQQLESLGIHVRFAGNVVREQVPDEIRKAHIHVVPSRWQEPCSLSILEGMSCGLATVGSKSGGTPEVVGDYGLLFERDDPADLARQLERLVLNPELRAHYAQRGRARALERRWDVCWNRFTQLMPR
ncbi:MAG TPA: glycosyltransferase family 4 protein [Phycisphaerae bacterium]|nr:glycosyltransferase family 4 protein [Phycisphaerae bacterium]